MFNKIATVTPLPEYILLVCFTDNTKKKYDVKLLFDKWEVFKSLFLVKGLFEQVKVDTGGYGVTWNDDIDLSCNEIYNNGVEV